MSPAQRIELGDHAATGLALALALAGERLQLTLLILDLADFRTVVAHHPELGRAIDAEGRRRLSDNQQRRELHKRGAPAP